MPPTRTFALLWLAPALWLGVAACSGTGSGGDGDTPLPEVHRLDREITRELCRCSVEDGAFESVDACFAERHIPRKIDDSLQTCNARAYRRHIAETGPYWRCLADFYDHMLTEIRNADCIDADYLAEDLAFSGCGEPPDATQEAWEEQVGQCLSREHVYTCPDSDAGSALGEDAVTGTLEGADLVGSCGGLLQDAAFEWTAPDGGSYRFEATSESFGGPQYMYIRSSCDDADLVCVRRRETGLHATVELEAGETVVIALDRDGEPLALDEGDGEFAVSIRRADT